MLVFVRISCEDSDNLLNLEKICSILAFMPSMSLDKFWRAIAYSRPLWLPATGQSCISSIAKLLLFAMCIVDALA